MANRHKGIMFEIISFKGKNIQVLKKNIQKGILKVQILPLKSKNPELCRFYILRKGKRDYCLKKAKYQVLLCKNLKNMQVWYETVLCPYHKQFISP